MKNKSKKIKMVKLTKSDIKHLIKNVLKEYITRDMVSLKYYLSQTEEQKKRYLPHEYSWFFEDFLEEEDIEFDFPRISHYTDSDGNDIEQDISEYERIEWLEKNEPEIYNKFADYLYEKITNYTLPIDNAEYPAWVYFDSPKLVKNQWLIHFTNEPEDIAYNGFKYGVDEMEKLGLTTHLADFDKKYGGYNFAYLLADFDRYGRAGFNSRGGKYKYGKHAVIFRASGIRTYHSGDQEPQVIFYGNTAKNIIPIKEGENADWAIYNTKTGRTIVEMDDLKKLAYWVENNYDQFRKKI